MPNLDAVDKLRAFGVKVDQCHYMLNDSLASVEDLDRLFEVLKKHTDRNGRHPVLTANVVMTNPDFERIKASNYKEYHYKPFQEDMSKSKAHEGAFANWKRGMSEGVFYPQFHGREHVNIHRWMRDLQAGNEEALYAFELGVFGVSGHVVRKKRASYLAAFDGEYSGRESVVAESVTEGLQMFHDTFGFKAESFIAPNYVWDGVVEEAAAREGVKYFQGANVQRLPVGDHGKRAIKRNSLGSLNEYGQRYLVRNCFFEPSSRPEADWVESCMSQIAAAFRMRKPAVIDSHRVNYVGHINVRNRDMNLPKLDALLSGIIKRWPEVEFVTSVELGEMIEEND